MITNISAEQNSTYIRPDRQNDRKNYILNHWRTIQLWVRLCKKGKQNTMRKIWTDESVSVYIKWVWLLFVSKCSQTTCCIMYHSVAVELTNQWIKRVERAQYLILGVWSTNASYKCRLPIISKTGSLDRLYLFTSTVMQQKLLERSHIKYFLL